MPFSVVSLANSSEASFTSNFGAIGDGSTNNATAWNRFNTWARAESTAGRGVVLRIPPGTYNFNHADCIGFLLGIKNLHIIGDGATIQNTYDYSVSGGGLGERPWGYAANPDLFAGGKLINTTAVDDTTITLTTAADNTTYLVNDWIMVASLDIQYSGYPPNIDKFEFVKIISKNAGAGTFVVSPALRYDHQSTYPDGGSQASGRARIWHLKSSDGDPWDVDHTYEGLKILIPPNTILWYITVCGRNVRFLRCTIPGISETISESVEFIKGHITHFSEPDKLVGSCLYEDSIIETTANGVHFAFQSSSIDRVVFRNCRVNNLLNTGSAKSVSIQNCEISGLIIGGGLGLNRQVLIRDSFVRHMEYSITPFRMVASATIVDGVNITYSNGTFAVTKASGELINWSPVPGCYINLMATGNLFSGDLGTAIVTRVYEDATKVYIETTLRHTSIPAWSSGAVLIQRNGRFSAVNCTGCDNIRIATEATARNKNPYEFYRYVFVGKTSTNGSWYNYKVGDLKSVRVNVAHATAVAGSRFVLTTSARTKSAMDDAKSYILTFDVTVTGERVFTQSALTGKTANDTVTLGGVAQTTNLPVGRWIAAGGATTFEWGYTVLNTTTLDPYQIPVLELDLEFDTGIWGKTITANKDGSVGVIGAVTGSLP